MYLELSSILHSLSHCLLLKLAAVSKAKPTFKAAVPSERVPYKFDTLAPHVVHSHSCSQFENCASHVKLFCWNNFVNGWNLQIYKIKASQNLSTIYGIHFLFSELPGLPCCKRSLSCGNHLGEKWTRGARRDHLQVCVADFVFVLWHLFECRWVLLAEE